MKKRWMIALLLSSSSQASWYIEPRLYSGDELSGGVMAYYSLPWVEVGGGLLSNFNASKNKYELDAEVQLSKAFQLNERWALSIGFGSLLGEHWLSDYQFRYRVGDFSWLTAGYRYHLEEDYNDQNQFYLGYRFSFGEIESSKSSVEAQEVIDSRPAPRFFEHKFPTEALTIQFDFNDSTIKDVMLLNKVIEAMNTYPQLKLKIKGYSDSTGSYMYNLKLSDKRAKAVANYLKNKGIAAERIIVESCGEENPVANNTSRQGRAMNRRVEVYYSSI
ncbi:OmpA family protein [Vibrio parahaemolyticus]